MKKSPEAEAVLCAARKKAKRLRHNFLGAEHVLHAILTRRGCDAWWVLEHFGLGFYQINELLLATYTPGTQTLDKDCAFPFGCRMETIIEIAEREATDMCRSEISSGHILLGIILEGESDSAKLLRLLYMKRRPKTKTPPHST